MDLLDPVPLFAWRDAVSFERSSNLGDGALRLAAFRASGLRGEDHRGPRR